MDEKRQIELLQLLATYDGKACRYLTRDLQTFDAVIARLDQMWFEKHEDRECYIRRPIGGEFDPRAPQTADQVVYVKKCPHHGAHRTHFLMTGRIEWMRLDSDRATEASVVLIAMSPGESWGSLYSGEIPPAAIH